ncbi:nitrous oxide reductase family maturation protein NosD [Schinkia sp. CFF1]
MKVFLALLLFLLLSVPMISFASGGNTKSTEEIQRLIQSAEIGDKIMIPKGIYRGNLHIDKSVSLIADGDVTIIGDRKGDVISFEADGVTFRGFTVKNSGRILTTDDAALKLHSSKNRIVNNCIIDSLHGIYLDNSKENIIEGNILIGDKALVSADRGNGIHLFYSSKNKIIENEIYETRDGIYFSFADYNVIKGNKIHDTRYGLHYMYSDDNSFYKNRFYNNIGGAAIMYSDRITLENNYFYNNRGLISFGLLLQTANDTIIKHNRMTMNQKGLFMDQSNRNLLANNDISHNNIGIEIWTSSIENSFTQNQFNHNVIQYSSNGKHDQNKWSHKGIGNYWSNHALYDLDNNGIGDRPYTYSTSFGEVLAQNQLGYLFLDSPALKIYESVKQTLSKDHMQITDPHPILPMDKKGNAQMLTIILFSGAALFIFFKVRRKVSNGIRTKRMERDVSE